MLQKKGHEIALRPKEFLDKYDIEVEMKKQVYHENFFNTLSWLQMYIDAPTKSKVFLTT